VTRTDLPSGTVTFLFTDIEGSTKLLHELGAEGYEHALLEHRRIMRDLVARHRGVEIDTQGDAFFIAFAGASEAVAAASEAQAALASGPIQVRMGLHTGRPHLGRQGYVGTDVHKGARIAAAGHGGQVLLSRETRELAGLEVLDLGEHRLKDFDTPVEIFQLGHLRFPPLKTISNTNLPRPASSFVGREREVAEIAALLRDGARLLTLTGPGGTGKTRLAIESAAEIVPEFKAGVFFVGLAALRDPELVSKTVGHTIGAKDGLADYVGEREMLLLLDNLEQVVAAAPELAELVEACPNLRVLTTSRELLRVRGEVEYAVSPLADRDAIELFCSRSGLAEDKPIGELCRRLDNLPLAVELAAARTSVLSPAQILDRLAKRLDLLKGGRDTDPRQQTLRATIEWSYDLLTADEQRLFARLAAFAAGCTLPAAEEVAEADIDTLQSLVEKSLVRHATGRFSMLETIRQFAAERLEASGEADGVRRRHAAWYLAIAEDAYPNLKGSPKEWLDRLDVEHDNLRAALDWLEGSGETQLALQLAGALYRFWYMRGYPGEGLRRIDRLLLTDDGGTAARARALNGAAVLAGETGSFSTATLRSEEALALHRELGDAWGAAYSIFNLAMSAADQGSFERARDYFEQSVKAFRELGDEHYTLTASDGLAWMYGELGDREHRRAMHEDVLRQARAQSNERMVAMSLDQLAMFAREDGRIQESIDMSKEELRIQHDLGERAWIAVALGNFGETLAAAGRAESAVRLIAASEALLADIGGGPSWLPADNARRLAIVRQQLDEASFSEAWKQGQALTVDEAVALALDS
jgi:predicted ATPase